MGLSVCGVKNCNKNTAYKHVVTHALRDNGFVKFYFTLYHHTAISVINYILHAY